MPYRPDVDTTLARYAEAWNTDDADARWSLVHACAADGVTWLGPETSRPVEGQAALAAFLGMPGGGGRFELGRPDVLHAWVRVPWRRLGADAEARGLMVARLDREHRLVEILHFANA